MVTKREVAAAHNEMVEALGLWAHLAGMQPLMPGGPERVTLLERERILVDCYCAWNELRLQLDGQGPAVARSTSIAAAKANIMLKQSLRRTILSMVVSHYRHFGTGMTSDEIQGRLKGKHQSVSARVSELVNIYEFLVDSGEKRETSSKAKATVWKPTHEAIDLVQAAEMGAE